MFGGSKRGIFVSTTGRQGLIEVAEFKLDTKGFEPVRGLAARYLVRYPVRYPLPTS